MEDVALGDDDDGEGIAMEMVRFGGGLEGGVGGGGGNNRSWNVRFPNADVAAVR